MSNRSLRLLVLAAACSVAMATDATAQKSTKKKPAAAATASKSTPIAGSWMGTASVPLPDSTIVVPVFYTFTESPTGMTGTAMVPGQGSGPISNVVREGEAVRFRVTVKQNNVDRNLDHDARLLADGAIEGMVNLDSKPIAKFRITPNKTTPKK